MGLISRVKTWIFQEDLASADLNAEFDNVLNNLDSGHIVGDSASVGQMQTQTSPGAVGSESLAPNVQGEIERLRYVIQRFLGSFSPYWYSAPAVDLTTIKASLPNLAQLQNGVVSGAVDANGQPMFLVPSGSTNAITFKATATPFVCYINGILTTFIADVTLSGLTVAPGANNTALIDKNVNGGNYSNAALTKSIGEPDTNLVLPDPVRELDLGVGTAGNYINLKTVGSNITAQNEKQIAFKLNAEYSLGKYRNGGLTRLEDCMRGCFFDSTSTALPRVGFADGDTVTLEQIAYLFILSGGTLDVTYNQPFIGAQTPSSPTSGDYWYDAANNLWKKYNGTSFVSNPACYLGLAVTNTTATVAARSTDFINAYSDQNGILLRKDATTNSRSVSAQTGIVSVYGQLIGGFGVQMDFSTSRDIDGSLAAGDFIFYYLDKTGKQRLSNIAPNRRPELSGYYHPSKPWRCIASGYTSDGSKLDYVVRNLKSVNQQRSTLLSRGSLAYTAAAGDANIATIKVLCRGGRLVVRLQSGTVSVSNSGANPTKFIVLATPTDEYANVLAGVTLGEVASDSAGSAGFAAASGFMADFGNQTGCFTIVVSSNVTSSGGTNAVAISAPLEVWELF